MTPEGVVNFCSSFLKNMGDQERCYTSMFYVVTAQVQFDIPRMKKYCGDLPDYVMGRCFANVASRLIETDYRNISNSVDMCNTAPKQDVKDYCFNELLFYSTYNFRGGSEASNQLCNSLPDPWKNQCLK